MQTSVIAREECRGGKTDHRDGQYRPENGEELGAPFFQATVAAAMDYEVEVVCTATAGN
jgi:hypothetical protein